MKKTIITGLSALLLAACGGNKADADKEPAAAPSAGKSVYEAQCTRCHGSNGKLGLSGAKDLTATKLSTAEMETVIAQGANGGMMPAFGEVLSADEIKATADYIETALKN